MMCTMLTNLQVPALLIYPIIWGDIFQQFFDKNPHTIIPKDFYVVSNAQKDFKVAYKFFSENHP